MKYDFRCTCGVRIAGDVPAETVIGLKRQRDGYHAARRGNRDSTWIDHAGETAPRLAELGRNKKQNGTSWMGGVDGDTPGGSTAARLERGDAGAIATWPIGGPGRPSGFDSRPIL